MTNNIDLKNVCVCLNFFIDEDVLVRGGILRAYSPLTAMRNEFGVQSYQK